MDTVKPRELLTAARIADALVYVVGIAGVVAGGLLYRSGDVAFAVVAWVLTFVAGAALRLASWVARGVAQLLIDTTALREEVRADRAHPAPNPTVGRDVADPYGRWGWHR